MIDVFNLDTQHFEPYNTNLIDPLRRALNSTVWNDKLVIFGGLGTNPTGMPPLFDNATVFDPHASAFSDAVLPKLPQTLFAPGACFTGAKFVVAGGQPNLTSNPTDLVWTLEPGQSDWREMEQRLKAPSMFVELLPVSQGPRVRRSRRSRSSGTLAGVLGLGARWKGSGRTFRVQTSSMMPLWMKSALVSIPPAPAHSPLAANFGALAHDFRGSSNTYSLPARASTSSLRTGCFSRRDNSRPGANFGPN
jgi:hypothetical protein